MDRFKYFTDPGHGWLRVRPADVYAVGLSRAHFTPCSYRTPDDKFWYLEEDQDAGLFIRAWERMFDNHFTYTRGHTNGFSRIRKLPALWSYSTWDREAWEVLTKEPANV